MEMRTQELNRVKIMEKSLETSCKRIIKVLDKKIEHLEKSLSEYVDEKSEWSEKRELLISTPGVGNTLVYTILADLPEIGTLNNKEISALVGVAPMNRDSSSWRGKRKIQDGRATSERRSIWQP